jgi:predicted dehydrogenase
MQSKLKIAVVGAGNIGKTHLRCYANHTQAQPVAVCDMAHDKAQALAEQYGLRAYSSVEDLLRNEELMPSVWPQRVLKTVATTSSRQCKYSRRAFRAVREADFQQHRRSAADGG